jgi:hypothetical protein
VTDNELTPHRHVDPVVTNDELLKKKGSMPLPTPETMSRRPVKPRLQLRRAGEVCLDFTFHV